MTKLSVILTAWQRPQYLEEQVNAVINNSIQPIEIVLWYNKPPKRFSLFDQKQITNFTNSKKVKKIYCDYNFGIFPRFTLASCLEGEYICIFDDDTIPGQKWFENCLRYIDKENALLGTIGLRYKKWVEKVETETPRMGWEGMNKELEFVDLVGHSWFFRREWARFLWDSEPPSRNFGEDIHFCAMLQNHNIKIACPPHPKNDRKLWGSVKPERGRDKVAISSQDKSAEYLKVVKAIISNGFKPVLQK